MGKIKKILIANRGEIALRALRTIKEMDKEVVVVYAKADEEASYIQFADTAICIGERCFSNFIFKYPCYYFIS